MKYPKDKNMSEYPKPTKLCDCDNPRLKEKAGEIIRGGLRRQGRQHLRCSIL